MSNNAASPEPNAVPEPQKEPSPREREFCEWMMQFNDSPEFIREFTTRFINACNERVLKGGYPTHFSELSDPLPSQGGQDKWISVDQELPPNDTEVLVWNGSNLGVDWIDEHRHDGPEWAGDTPSIPTHWQPIPAPPAPAKESSQCLNK